MTHTKRNAILMMLIALLAILVLVAGLTGLKLLPGEPFPLDSDFRLPTNYSGNLPGGEQILAVIRIFFFIAIVLFPISVIYFLISPQARKQLIKLILRAVVVFLFLYLAIRALQRFKANQDIQQIGSPLTPPETPLGVQKGIEFVANPSQGLILALSIGLALILLLLVGMIVWYIWRRSKKPPKTYELLAEEAQQALDELQAGGNLRNVVVRCYAEMSQVVSQQRGLQRGKSMTPHEFIQLLERQGIPAKPVRQLTEIFEAVRYGTQPVGQREEILARDSLSAIVEACTHLS